MRLWLDVETRSRVPINRGVYRYAEDVEIILWQWAVDNGPVQIAESFPDELQALFRNANEIWAHNAQFDRVVLAHAPGYKLTMPPIEKWRCTAALARMHGMPGGLDKLCTILKIPHEQAKLSNGKNLIQLFCVPHGTSYYDKDSHPKEWADFRAYGGRDITAMRAVEAKLPKWNATPRMWKLWHLDQTMNDRGLCVDQELASAIVQECTAERSRLAQHTKDVAELIDGNDSLESTTQRGRLMAYLAEYGIVLTDMKADTIARRLEDETLPAHMRWLLTMRQETSRSSTTKAKRLLECVSADGRLRGLTTFCGAQRTGRKTGNIFNPLNLPRPKHAQAEIDLAIEMFKDGRIGEMELFDPGKTISYGADALRGLAVASPGNKIISADWSAIEGRLTAWCAGEDFEVQAYHLNDIGEGPKPYAVTAGRAFSMDPSAVNKKSFEYLIGKIMSLALGFQGAVGAFAAMSETYGLRIPKLADAAIKFLRSPELILAKEAYRNAQMHYALSEREWCVLWCLVQIWRRSHPRICAYWYELDAAVRKSLDGKTVKCGPVAFQRIANWTLMTLPSGRSLCYPGMRVEMDGSLSFWGVNQYTKQWKRIPTYGGKLMENIAQGIAVDLHDDALLGAEATGLRPVLSVYDEINCDATMDRSVKELEAIMCHAPDWAEGLPLATEGWEGPRYHK